MTGRSPARLLAPVALIVTVLALFVIVTGGGGSEDDPETTAAPTATATAAKPGAKSTTKTKSDGPRTYRVKPGDTPSTIAEDAGIPLETLLELNPNVDPQALSPGQRLKLRP